MSDKPPTQTTVTCPHCGDVTQQSFMLEEFTCGACDEPFSPIPKADTDVSPGILELIRMWSPSALKELRPHLFEYRCADGDILILEERTS